MASNILLNPLMLSFPGQGHLNSMLRLSTLLSSRGAYVTFLVTEKAYNRMLESSSACAAGQNAPGGNGHLQFVTIVDGLDEPAKPGPLDAIAISKAMQAQEAHIEKLVVSSRTSPTPISCIVADRFLPWAQDLADRLGIPRVLYWTPTATWLYLSAYIGDHKNQFSGSYIQSTLEAKLQVISPEVTTIIQSFPVMNEDEMELLRLTAYRLEDAAAILVNSFLELEEDLAADLFSKLAPNLVDRVHYVGPVPPSGGFGSMLREDHGCLAWLDTQHADSVLFVSFGSFAHVSQPQFEQIGWGIEESQVPFLWVVRQLQFKENEVFLHDFIKRTKNRGLIISWAPQIPVLRHPAVGGFMTHCGWNSSLESIMMGVPMLCWPQFGDQWVNAALLVMHWRLALGINELMGESDFTHKEEVQKGIVKLMQSEEGDKARMQIALRRDAATRALQEAGSSSKELRALM